MPRPTPRASGILGFILLVALGWGELKDRGLPHTRTVGPSHTLSAWSDPHRANLWASRFQPLQCMCSSILDTHKELFWRHAIQESRPGQGLEHQGCVGKVSGAGASTSTLQVSSQSSTSQPSILHSTNHYTEPREGRSHRPGTAW